MNDDERELRDALRHRLDGGQLAVMSAADQGLGVAGIKTYAAGRGGASFVVALFDAASQELLAVIEADRLGQLGYLDDAAFARWWGEQRDRHAPRGRRIQHRDQRSSVVAMEQRRVDRRHVLESLADVLAVRDAALWVSARAPVVRPWKAPSAATMPGRPVRRLSLIAASTTSEPEFAKKTVSSPAGVIEASSSARATYGS